MSILFDAATEKHTIASDATIDSLDAMTLVLWYMATSVTSSVHVAISKRNAASSSGFSFFRPTGGGGPDDWKFIRDRPTTDSTVLTNGNIVQVGRWEFVAIADDTSAVSDIIHGTLSTRPTQPSLFSSTKGVGTVVDDSANGLLVGSSVNTNQSAHAHIGFLGLWNRRMTVAQMQAQWHRPHCNDGCVLFSFPGLHGSTALVDLSGNKNNGTLTGSPTWSTPPPLPHGLLMPRRGRAFFQSATSVSRRVSLGGAFVESGRTVLIG